MDGYIALKSMCSVVYTMAGDMWSLRRTASYHVSKDQDAYWGWRDAPRDFDDLLVYLEAIALTVSSARPARPSASGAPHPAVRRDRVSGCRTARGRARKQRPCCQTVALVSNPNLSSPYLTDIRQFVQVIHRKTNR